MEENSDIRRGRHSLHRRRAVPVERSVPVAPHDACRRRIDAARRVYADAPAAVARILVLAIAARPGIGVDVSRRRVLRARERRHPLICPAVLSPPAGDRSGVPGAAVGRYCPVEAAVDRESVTEADPGRGHGASRRAGFEAGVRQQIREGADIDSNGSDASRRNRLRRAHAPSVAGLPGCHRVRARRQGGEREGTVGLSLLRVIPGRQSHDSASCARPAARDCALQRPDACRPHAHAAHETLKVHRGHGRAVQVVRPGRVVVARDKAVEPAGARDLEIVGLSRNDGRLAEPERQHPENGLPHGNGLRPGHPRAVRAAFQNLGSPAQGVVLADGPVELDGRHTVAGGDERLPVADDPARQVVRIAVGAGVVG